MDDEWTQFEADVTRYNGGSMSVTLPKKLFGEMVKRGDHVVVCVKKLAPVEIATPTPEEVAVL